MKLRNLPSEQISVTTRSQLLGGLPGGLLPSEDFQASTYFSKFPVSSSSFLNIPSKIVQKGWIGVEAIFQKFCSLFFF